MSDTPRTVDQPSYYSATITCVSCQARLSLPYQEGPPTRADHLRLADIARSRFLWKLMRGGVWVCSELRYVEGAFICREAARRYVQIRRAARLSGSKLKPINPDYFGTTTIANLGDSP